MFIAPQANGFHAASAPELATSNVQTASAPAFNERLIADRLFRGIRPTLTIPAMAWSPGTAVRAPAAKDRRPTTSRCRGRQRERERLAVAAGTQRLRGADVLPEGDRHRVVGHRGAPAGLAELDPQGIGEREGAVGQVAGVADAQRRVTRGADHVGARGGAVVLLDPWGERPEARGRTQREAERRRHRTAGPTV